jgi:hypothetical protein
MSRSWWSISKRVIGGLLKGKGRGTGSLGIGYNLSLAAVFTLLRPGTGALRGWGNSFRFLTGRSFNSVVMTFITRNFSRGWWTSAVQGPKLFKIFFMAGKVLNKNVLTTVGHG